MNGMGFGYIWMLFAWIPWILLAVAIWKAGQGILNLAQSIEELARAVRNNRGI